MVIEIETQFSCLLAIYFSLFKYTLKSSSVPNLRMSSISFLLRLFLPPMPGWTTKWVNIIFFLATCVTRSSTVFLNNNFMKLLNIWGFNPAYWDRKDQCRRKKISEGYLQGFSLANR